MKICIVGAPSCRKTTTAERVKTTLKIKGYDAEIAPEVARTYIRRCGVPESVAEQYIITRRQIDLENHVALFHDIVICDSSSFLGYIYASQWDCNDDKTIAIKNLVNELIMQHIHSYNLIFYAPKQNKLIEDGVRFQTDEEASYISEQIKGFLMASNIPHHNLKGDVDEKASIILDKVVDLHQKLEEESEKQELREE